VNILTRPLTKSSMMFGYPSYHSHRRTVFFVCGTWEGLRHDVGYHIGSGAVFKVNLLSHNELANEVILNLDGFGSGMIFWVTS